MCSHSILPWDTFFVLPGSAPLVQDWPSLRAPDSSAADLWPVPAKERHGQELGTRGQMSPSSPFPALSAYVPSDSSMLMSKFQLCLDRLALFSAPSQGIPALAKLFQFPRAAVTDYYKLGDLKQHRCPFPQFQWPEV